MHEVFLKVHPRLADYDDTRPFRPWLFGFAYRVAADHRRLARHRVELLGARGEGAAETVPADEHIAVLEQRELVLCALDTIEIDRRAVLVMHDVDDMPVPQIAEMLDIPLNTAYTLLRLAREQLAGAVTRLHISRGAR